METLKMFNRWDISAIKVADLGLARYINLNPVLVPKTGGRYSQNRFHKSKMSIVERLINKVMNPGHKSKKHFKTSYKSTGKAFTAAKQVEMMFEIIEKRLKKNPIEVFVKALENAAMREEIITIEYGGARYPKAVDVSPQRRVDLTLMYMVQGSYQKSFNSRKGFANCLADEITNAFQLSPNSAAISKKNETERQADAAR
jgi:small subunit ribosomal protein S7